MKPVFLAAMMLLLMGSVSCHKPGNDTPAPASPTAPPGTWMYGPSRFTAQHSSWDSSNGLLQIVFFPASTTSADPTNITFLFLKRPGSSGDYKIVGDPRAGNEVSIFCDGGVGGTSYSTTGSDSAVAHLSFSGGKLSIYCDKAIVKSDKFVGADSTSLSFNLSEF